MTLTLTARRAAQRRRRRLIAAAVRELAERGGEVASGGDGHIATRVHPRRRSIGGRSVSARG
jgi:hypothetical protein